MTTNSLDFGSSHARRLPIYLMIECSEAMGEKALDVVNQGVKQLVADLMSEPIAVETAWLSVITYADQARQVAPLTEVGKFTPPTLTVGKGASLGAAFDLLAQSIYHEIRHNTESQKGDWKPLVFLLVSGKPTDDWQGALQRFQSYVSIVSLVAIGCGEQVDTTLLKAITPNVLLMKNMAPGTIKTFFKWVSASVNTASVSAASDGRTVSMPTPPPIGSFGMGGRLPAGEQEGLSFPEQEVIQPAQNQKFYGKLRRSITEFAKDKGIYGNYLEYILFAPDLFTLLTRLVMDGRVQPRLKNQLLLVLAYFISPIDPIPEAIVGPAGYIDDIVLSCLTLLNLVGDTDEEILRQHWAGQGDIVALLRKVTGLGQTLVGSPLWVSMKKKLGLAEKEN